MKPTNILDVIPGFWVLRDDRGEFYAYSTPTDGVRCTDKLRLARKYGSKHGANSARHKILQAYGKHTQPTHFTIRLTYHETQAVPG